MKDIIIGDPHFGRKNNSRERHNDTMAFFTQYLPEICKSISNKDSDTRLIVTGDMFDSKQNIDTYVSNDCFDAFEYLSSILPVILYLGNHDLLVRENGKTKSSAKSFSYMKNITLVEEFKTIGGTSFLPFYKEKSIEREFVEQCQSDVIYTHTEIEGFWYGGKAIESGPKSLPQDIFTKFKRVFNGHVHKKQSKGNILNVGSPYHLKYSDVGNLTHLHVYDYETDRVKIIDNTFSPKFKLFHFFEFVDKTISDIKSELNNNYVKVMMPNNIYGVIDVNKLINNTPDGYKEFSYDSLMQSNDDNMLIVDEETDDYEISSIDIVEKYNTYIDDTVDIDSVMLTTEQKSVLKNQFLEIHQSAEKEININDLDSI